MKCARKPCHSKNGPQLYSLLPATDSKLVGVGMNEPPITPSRGESQPAPVKSVGIADILWENALEALVKTILILVLGSVVIGFMGHLWHEMAPSTPPGFKTRASPESSAPAWSVWSSTFQRHRFVIVFAMVFALTSRARLCGPSSGGKSTAGIFTSKMGRRLSSEWFGLLIWNAVGALGAAIVIYWAEQFSYAKWIYGWLLQSLLPGIRNIAIHLLGIPAVDRIQDWFAWYGENQLKFNFWIFYLAAICDDLGLPNLKSLARFVLQPIRNRWVRDRTKRHPDSVQASN